MPMSFADPSIAAASDELLEIDEALEKLASEDVTAAEIVKQRYFVGLSTEQAADALGIARATAYRHWAYTKAWLRCEIERQRLRKKI